MRAKERRFESSCRGVDVLRRSGQAARTAVSTSGKGRALVPLLAVAVLAGCGLSSGPRHIATPEEMANLCAGVPDGEREHPSVLRPPELEGVREAMGERRLIKTSIQELRGAELVVRASPGMTKQWMARVLRCHIAYRDQTPAAMPAETFPDPLMVDRAEVTFDETETGFLIRIRGANKTEGKEILALAQQLVAR